MKTIHVDELQEKLEAGESLHVVCPGTRDGEGLFVRELCALDTDTSKEE